MKLRYLRDKDPWMLAEDIPDMDFQFSQIWLSSFVNDLEKTVGINYKKILCVYRGYNLKFYFGDKDSDVFAEHVLGLILHTPGFGQKVNDQIRVHSARLKSISKKITPAFLKKLSDRELTDFYLLLDKVHTELYTWGWLGNAVDMFHGNFTRYLKVVLAKQLSTEDINTAMVALTANPEKTVIQKENESFLRLMILVLKGVRGAQFKKAIRKHYDKYFYLKHLWIGKEGVYDLNYYIKEIKKFIASKQDPRAMLKKDGQALQAILREQARLIKILKLTVEERKTFKIYSELAVTKIIRRDAQIYWAYKMDFVFKELSRRLKTPFMEVRFMFPWEITAFLKKGFVASSLKRELKERVKYCVYYAENGHDKIFIGDEARKMESTIKEESTEGIKEFSGHTACLGKAKGVVKVINSVSDMKKMKEGNILVSIATNPDIVPAMKKAAAIVTEQGGITSHAAIVSRELNIPCIIGTKIATKVLKDGDLVEVDAMTGVVKKL